MKTVRVNKDFTSYSFVKDYGVFKFLKSTYRIDEVETSVFCIIYKILGVSFTVRDQVLYNWCFQRSSTTSERNAIISTMRLPLIAQPDKSNIHNQSTSNDDDKAKDKKSQ